MRRSRGAWRRLRRLWLPALLLLLVNLGLLAAYRLVYAGRAEARVATFGRSTAELESLQRERKSLARTVREARRNRGRIEEFYGQRLGLEAERLTLLIAEIKKLARAAGLEPSRINYAREPIEDHGLLKRSLDFTVSGGYLELRRLINMLELTESFVVLEKVELSESTEVGGRLRINLQLSTLLAAGEGLPPRPAATGRAAR